MILRLAQWIAGPSRNEWMLAMVVEADAAGSGGARWAVGCLRWAVTDRLVRDRWFLTGLMLLPALALLLIVPFTLAVVVGAHALGASTLVGAPLLQLAPLPVAWLLGHWRPSYPAALVGTLAFAVHQSIPLIAMTAMSGRMPQFWSPNMIYYNLPASAGLIASWAAWLIATWSGGVAQRRRSAAS